MKEERKEMTQSVSLYVGTYNKYFNQNSLAGAWVEVDKFTNYKDFVEFCKELHKDEGAPRFMIQDTDNLPDAWYQENGLPSEERFYQMQELSDLDDKEREAFELYLDNINKFGDVDDFKESYVGYYLHGGREYAEEYVRDMIDSDYIPSIISYNINYNGVWYDLEREGYVEIRGHVFK